VADWYAESSGYDQLKIDASREGASAEIKQQLAVMTNTMTELAKLTGAGGALLIGGDATTMNLAMTTAQNAAQNNRQLHADEKALIKTLAQGDPQKEYKLTAAACAMVKCYAEYPIGSQAYDTLKAMADDGSSIELAAERQELAQQKGLFNYGTHDQSVDTLLRFNNTYQVATRAMGAVQAVAGTLGVAGSIITAPASCATGIGCVANAAVAGISADGAYAGAKQVVSGLPESTFTNQALQSLGLSPEAAGYAEFALGLSAAATAARTINAAIDANAAANAWAKNTYTGEAAIAFDGRVYRFTDPKYASTTWEIHPGNINSPMRYSEPGVGSIYSGTSVQTSAAEVRSYADAAQPFTPKALVAGNVQIDGILDLTNPAAQKALGVTRDQILQSSHGANGAYTQTQRIAEWARGQGYNGILAPSAQNQSGTNLITFDNTKITNLVISPQPISPPPFGRTTP
jgi:filamentous hemagglutinin